MDLAKERGKTEKVIALNSPNQNDVEQILREIKKSIENLKLYKILVFGSAVSGKFHKDSDVDLVIILDKKGIAKTYKERIENRRIVSKLLRDLRKKIPIDLFVYTKDEWDLLQKSGSTFYREIEEKGRVIT